jgi:hypothetical protein
MRQALRRLVLVVLVVLVCGASLAAAADPSVMRPPVRLDTPAELARLQATNPAHYARARRLIEAANVLCPPRQAKLQGADLDSRRVACGHVFLTSNPPKREITFTLDGTRYAALVAITADPPRAVRAE